MNAMENGKTDSTKKEIRLLYCRTPTLPAFFFRKNVGWRTYRHPGAIGLYVWIRDVQHHFRIEKV